MNEDQQPPFIPAWMRKQHWTPHQWAIYCYVASWGKCFVNGRTIAKELHMTRPVFLRELRELVRLGWIQKQTGENGKPNIYSVSANGKPMVRAGRPRSVQRKTGVQVKPPMVSGETPLKEQNHNKTAGISHKSTHPGGVHLEPLQYQHKKEEEDWRTKRDNEPEHLKKVEALKGVYWQRYEEAIKAGDWQMAKMWLMKARRGGINNEVTDD